MTSPNKLQIRRGTAANWTAVNPVLSSGEPALETDTGKTKIGDGSTAWNTLPYQPNTGDLNATYAPVSGSANYAAKASNLSDLASASMARTNLGLGDSATHSASDFIAASQKGAASGVATLDSGSLVPLAQIPDLSATYTTPAAVGAQLSTVTVSGAGGLQSAINAAAAFGVRRVLVDVSVTVTSSVTLPATTPLTIECADNVWITAGATMSAVLSKAAGVASGYRLVRLNIDAAQLADRCVDFEQGHRLFVDGGVWQNALVAVAEFGRLGGQVYESKFDGIRIIGLDNGRSGATPAGMPAYGIKTGTGVTDSYFNFIVGKNCATRIFLDQGTNNTWIAPHPFPYPVQTSGSATDYNPAAGMELAGSVCRVFSAQLDTLKTGLILSGTDCEAFGTSYLSTSTWAYTGAVNPIYIQASGVAVHGGIFLRSGATGIPAQQTLTVTATGGTYTLTGGVGGSGTTTAIAYNDSAATIQAALALLPGFSAATVTGTGPFLIAFPNWRGPVTTITVATGSLTGGSATLTSTQAGVFGWTGSPIRFATGVTAAVNNINVDGAWTQNGGMPQVSDDGAVRGPFSFSWRNANPLTGSSIRYGSPVSISTNGDNGELVIMGGSVPGRVDKIGSGATGYIRLVADTSGAGVQIGKSTNKLGFFGTTPAAQAALSYGRITESAAAAALRALLAAYGLVTDSTTAPAIPSGSYVHLISPSTAGTSATLSNGALRTAPVILPAVTLARVGAEITSAGSAGCTLRLGIYADNGSGQPGTLIQDFGTVAADAVALPEITLGTPLVLTAGLYHIGAALQGNPATQPTVRTASIPDIPQGVLIPMGTSLPAANTSVVGNSMSSVTGALPSTFTVSGGTGSVVRLFAKLA